MTFSSSGKPEDRRAQVLITATALQDRLGQGLPTVILAVRGADSIAPLPVAAHPRLPGAQDAGLAEDFSAPSDPIEGSRPLPSAQALQGAVTRWGIGTGDRIVVYDHDGGLLAARAWWVLRWAGLDVRLLDGGFQGWARQGYALDTQVPPPPPPGDALITPGRLAQFGPDEALQLGQDGVLLDSRIAPNYAGGPTEPGQPARGHIPGAWNIPAAANLTADGHVADEATLTQLYAPTGALSGTQVGVYCGAGVSAAHDVLALWLLGVEASMYPGSWSAWSSDPTRPVTTGPQR
jgi:thiosulfate/3-mercaptopyruvate sulfurtransferase